MGGQLDCHPMNIKCVSFSASHCSQSLNLHNHIFVWAPVCFHSQPCLDGDLKRAIVWVKPPRFFMWTVSGFSLCIALPVSIKIVNGCQLWVWWWEELDWQKFLLSSLSLSLSPSFSLLFFLSSEVCPRLKMTDKKLLKPFVLYLFLFI